METSYQYFKRIGMRETPLSKLPSNYAWITGCGNGNGAYYNFFMPTNHIGTTDSDYAKHGIMCRVK